MKKVIALLLAGALVFGASMTCFATPSGETSTPEDEQKILNEFDLEDIFGDDAEDYKVAGKYGSDTLPEPGEDGIITHCIKIEGLEEGDEAYIFAYIDGKWVDVTWKVSDGKVCGKFTEKAPYVVVTEKGAVSSGGEGDSPQTGDMTAVPMLIAVAAAAGMAVTTRRRMA